MGRERDLIRPVGLVALALLGLGPRLAGAQIPIPQRTGAPDTVQVDPFREHPPISPMGALWRSMLLPGWGQVSLNRRVTGAVFVFWEGIALTMTLKSIHQLDYLKSVESEDDIDSQDRVDAKRSEIQDWAVLLAFNHLLAGVEAYVAAQLWDFPDELLVMVLPGGGVGMRVALPLPAF